MENIGSSNITNFPSSMLKIGQIFPKNGRSTKKVIYQVFNVSRAAPNSGVLKETGKWSYQEIINYKK